ncbi:MAG: sodium:calcium antiporter [Halobacterium sp.]
MFAALVTLLAGVTMLVYGGDRVVDGASALARYADVSTFFVGVTVVAVGSSLPEIATSVYAAAYGSGDLVVGHIVGSVTSQITLGVGVVALAAPLSVARHKTRIYGGGMLAAMAVMAVALQSGTITRTQGALMVVTYLGFLAVLAEHEDYAEHVRDAELTVRRATAYVLAGLALVLVGGHLLVTSGQRIAVQSGVPSYVVGLVTGLGTTTPEIAVSLVAVRRDRDGIAVGTLFGSNITDPLFSLGVGAALAGVHVGDVPGTLDSIGYMIVASAAVVAVVYTRRPVGRLGALACIVLYVPTFLI